MSNKRIKTGHSTQRAGTSASFEENMEMDIPRDDMQDSLIFKSLYSKAKDIFGNTRHDLKPIEANYAEFEKILDPKNLRMVWANIGNPNMKKSSSFNLFMIGSSEYPLPDSLKGGVEGVTLKPTRSEFKDRDDFEVGAYFEGNTEPEMFKTFQDPLNDSFHEFIGEKMKNKKIEEIIIHLPSSKYPEQSEKFKNVIFLDLIGLNDDHVNNETNNQSVQLNKVAIDREYVDAVFIFSGNRSITTPHTIGQLWKCGMFSKLHETHPPKLIVAAKFRDGDWTNTKGLMDLLNGYCQSSDSGIKECLQKQIRIALS